MAHQRILVVFQYSIKDIADCFFATALTPELYSVSTAAAAVQLQSSMNHDHACHMAYVCSGKPWQAGGGSWIGHVLPGVFLVAWGLHWFVAVTHQGLTGTRKQPVGAAHHTPVFLPAKLQVCTFETPARGLQEIPNQPAVCQQRGGCLQMPRGHK